MDRMNRVYRIEEKRLASERLFTRWVMDDFSVTPSCSSC
jgi:hypothetical protein